MEIRQSNLQSSVSLKQLLSGFLQELTSLFYEHIFGPDPRLNFCFFLYLGRQALYLSGIYQVTLANKLFETKDGFSLVSGLEKRLIIMSPGAPSCFSSF